MRLMIDGTSLLLSSAGVKTYMYYWIESLHRTTATHHITIFPYINSWRDLDHQHSQMSALSTQMRLAVVRFSNLTRSNVLDFPARSQDLFHASQHLIKPPTRTRLTATMYDATCWLFPEMHTPANIAATKLYAKRVLEKANGIIAISEATRVDAIRILRLPEDKVHCIYPSIPDSYFNVDEANIIAASERYHLQKPYLLYVGAIEPRKNLGRLLDAFSALPKSLREQYDLIVAGPRLWDSQQVLQRLANETGVRYLGYVPESDLPGLTAGAYAFVYPSLYEGFGLPVAQAVAAGVPVITSRTSSLPEVAGEAALFVDPYSVDEIRSQIQKLLLSPDIRARLAGHTRTHAERFRWEHNAARSWLFFEQICGAT
jgi:glycosyltransferase involved in cell wall biosynthesis